MTFDEYIDEKKQEIEAFRQLWNNGFLGDKYTGKLTETEKAELLYGEWDEMYWNEIFYELNFIYDEIQGNFIKNI